MIRWIPGETLERPIRKKVENEKLKKRKTSDDVVPRLFSQLGEIKEQKRRMHDEKKESMRIVLEEWRGLMHISLEKQRELICIKEEKDKVDKVKVEDEIMMKDDDAVKITSEPHDPHTLEIATCKKKEVTQQRAPVWCRPNTLRKSS